MRIFSQCIQQIHKSKYIPGYNWVISDYEWVITALVQAEAALAKCNRAPLPGGA